MTPAGARLKQNLDDEVLRMRNEWFFKWHHIGSERGVVMDNFNGGKIAYASISYDGSAQSVYWDAVSRYLRQRVVSLFGDVEVEVRSYDGFARKQLIDEAENLIKNFAWKIRSAAVEKDRILRGDGIRFPPERDLGRWHGSESHDIEEMARSMREIYCRSKGCAELTWTSLYELYDNHQFAFWSMSMFFAIVTFVFGVG